MADRYSNFAELAAGEELDVDYRIYLRDRGAPVVAVAPHGGHIEPGTSQIAAAVASNDLSLYAFEGLRPGRLHGDLHIASARFDEPQALDLVGKTPTAIAIHGRVDSDDPSVWAGGLDLALRDKIISALKLAGFDAATAHGNLAGRDVANICNRGASGAGVQLELPRTLRNQLATDPGRLRAFRDAIRGAALP